jgi:hypothetical protein
MVKATGLKRLVPSLYILFIDYTSGPQIARHDAMGRR